MSEENRAAEFSKSEKRAHLEQLLQDPVLIEAFDIVKEQMDPEVGTQADAIPAIAAAKMHQVAGAGDFRKRVRKLAAIPKETKQVKGRALATAAELEKENSK